MGDGRTEGLRLFEYDEYEAKVQQFGRGIYKWFLEFIRNCMVVAALVYLAQRSGNWWVIGVAALAYFALVGYCLSYLEMWKVPIGFLGEGRARRNFSMAIGIVMLQGIQAIVTFGLVGTIFKIVETQGH